MSVHVHKRPITRVYMDICARVLELQTMILQTTTNGKANKNKKKKTTERIR